MLATVLHGPGDIRYEDVAEPTILKPTDAIIKLAATCICGSDLWPYRGLQPQSGPPIWVMNIAARLSKSAAT